MPTAQINLGTATITLGASGDLSALATKPVVMTLLGDMFKGSNVLETPIGSIPPFSINPQIEFSDTGLWNVAGQSDALTLSVDAGVGGTLALIPAGGVLLAYPQNADGTNGLLQKACRGNQDCPYIKISLNVKYTV